MIGATDLLIVAAVFLLAGMIKGVLGFGLPTVSLALLSLSHGLPLAMQLFVAPAAISNLWQAVDGPHLGALLRRFAGLLLASAAGVWISYRYVFLADPRAMTRVLGGVLVLYGLYSLPGSLPLPKLNNEKLWSPLTGCITGVIAGVTGTLIVPLGIYLAGLRLKPAELVQMFGLSFMCSSTMIGISAAAHGQFSSDMFGWSLLSLIPALIGMRLGKQIRSLISPAVFRKIVLVGFVLVGLHLMSG